jgi:hypothetical protein
MTTASVDDFFDRMERYQIANNIDPLLKPKDQSKADKNEMNKSTVNYTSTNVYSMVH